VTSDETKLRTLEVQTVPLSGFQFHSGQVADVCIRVRISKPSEESRASDGIPVILYVHGLASSPNVASVDGIWPNIALPNAPWAGCCVVSMANLGSAFGSSNPEDACWPVDVRLSVWDQARALDRTLDELGVSRIALLTGASHGGMIAQCLTLIRSGIQTFVPIATGTTSSAWVLGFNHIAREVIRLGAQNSDAMRGLELARQLAILSYRAEAGLESKQGRQRPPHDNFAKDAPWAPSPRTRKVDYRVQSYLEYQGEKVHSRASAKSYLAQLDAMDSHDLSLPPKDACCTRIKGMQVHSVRLTSDVLFTERAARLLEDFYRQHGAMVERTAIRTPYGHDGFIVEQERMYGLFARVMQHVPRTL
jgi:homoserine O-acetyltransferase/O-succinyltransferase